MIYRLRDTLSLLVKGTKPIYQYLNDIQAVSEELDIAGSPIRNDELVIKVLNGIGP